MRLINVSNMEMEDFLDDSVPPYAILSHTWGPTRYLIGTSKTSGPLRQSWHGAKSPTLPVWRARKVWSSYGSILAASIRPAAPSFRKPSIACTDGTRSLQYASRSSRTLCASERPAPCSRERQAGTAWTAPRTNLRLDTANPSHDESQDERCISQYMLSDGFIRSKWFTRGWTLQELTAPSKVQFFDRDCSLIGDKHELSWALSWRSRIDVSVLRNETSVHAI